MNDNKMSRRKALGGLTLAMAAVAATPVLAHTSQPLDFNLQPVDLQDPTTKYPRPPFTHQNQPWPALASKMEPRPDHGETTYKGSGRLGTVFKTKLKSIYF